MKGLLVEEKDGLMVVSLAKGPPRVRLGLWAVLTSAAVLLFFRPGHPAYGHEWTSLRITALMLLTLCLAALPWLLRSLHMPEYQLDRARGLVTRDGQLLSALPEIAAVHLEQTDRLTSGGGDGRSRALWLRTRAHVQIEIAREMTLGPGPAELRSAADAICRYAGLDLVLPDGFVPASGGPAVRPRRFGGKRRATFR